LTLQYEQVNGHPREVSRVVIAGLKKTGQITIVERRQLRIGDNRHQDIFAAGLGPDTLGNRVMEL